MTVEAVEVGATVATAVVEAAEAMKMEDIMMAEVTMTIKVAVEAMVEDVVEVVAEAVEGKEAEMMAVVADMLVEVCTK